MLLSLIVVIVVVMMFPSLVVVMIQCWMVVVLVVVMFLSQRKISMAWLTSKSEFVRQCRQQLDIPLERLPSDIQEEKVVSDFMLAGCGCKKGGGGKQCCTQFSQEYVLSVENLNIFTHTGLV